jgi:hypothetical protein
MELLRAEGSTGRTDTESDTEELEMTIDTKEARTNEDSDEEEEIVHLHDVYVMLCRKRVDIGEKEYEKFETYLNDINDDPELTPKQKNKANYHCYTLLLHGKKFGNKKRCCGVHTKSGACTCSEEKLTKMKDESDEQKKKKAQEREKKAQEREDDKEIRAYAVQMLKEENKAKRAEANKWKKAVLEACNGMSAAAVQEAVDMHKADTKSVPMEESDEEDSDEEESDEEESHEPVTEELKQAIEFEKAIAELDANAQEACEAACAEACKQIKAEFQAEVAAEHMRLLANCS